MNTIKALGKDIPAAALLAALYNNTRPLGMGVLHDLRRDMTREEAATILEGRTAFSFDYVLGRPIKVHANDGEIGDRSIALYDRDAGPGQFAKAVEAALK